MLKKSSLIGLSLVVILLAGCSAQQTLKTLPEKRIKLAQGELTVELATTPEDQAKGLSGRPFLNKNRGMLFVFGQSDVYTFWMDKMNFSIDIIWFYQGVVVGINSNVPPPLLEDPRVQTVTPPQPVDMVLETSAGWAKENNVKEGLKIEYLP
ncbi:DUF192 domain-containing protein [Patescibacteria group bacterium]|nr:DUF192 domain-containing protein [Patescibacteria group bacterium]